jgi:hypothetical protein
MPQGAWHLLKIALPRNPAVCPEPAGFGFQAKISQTQECRALAENYQATEQLNL